MRRALVLVVVAVAGVAAAVGGSGDAVTAATAGAARGTPQALVASNGVTRMPALEGDVLVAINEYRHQHGLVPLRWNAQLTATARQHSLSMAENGYFKHSSPSGSPFWKRVEVTYSKQSARWTVGENLVWASPDLSASEVLALWLDSPPHRKNLLRRVWREVGLGAVHSMSAPGVYGGLAATILTADFGVRSG